MPSNWAWNYHRDSDGRNVYHVTEPAANEYCMCSLHSANLHPGSIKMPTYQIIEKLEILAQHRYYTVNFNTSAAAPTENVF